VRRELQDKPRSFQDLRPAFMREVQNWAKHEQTVELKEILRQNCIRYDGKPTISSTRSISISYRPNCRVSAHLDKKTPENRSSQSH
jgi:hypothetical protein